MSRFKLGDTTIDTLRGKITRDGDTKSVEPKVIAVLAILVEAKGNVVSQEKIFSLVWPDSIFSQSSVQRCIAILRKLLGDDAKNQTVIITYPKLGYSINPKILKLKNSGKQKRSYFLVGLMGLIFSMLFMLYYFQIANTKENIHAGKHQQVIESQLLNATEDNESQPQIISAQYLSYIRHEKNKGSAIWLYNRINQQETRITPYIEKIASYQWLNSSTLLYASLKQNIVEILRHKIAPENEKTFPITKTIIKLSNIDTFRGFFLTQDNKIIYQAVKNNRSQLRQYDLGFGEDVVLMDESEQFKPYGFSVNTHTAQVAIIGFNKLAVTDVKLLSLSTNEVQKIATLDSDIYHISWQNKQNKLLLTQGKRLLTLSITGQITEINYHTTAFIQQPIFSPNGQFIAFTKLQTDSDLWQGDSTNIKDNNTQRLVNSTGTDYAASYSPDGKKIAYISNKNGFPQIYTMDIESGATDLIFSNPERKLLLSPPLWHPIKNVLISSVNEKLLYVSLAQKTEEWQVVEQTAIYPLAMYKNNNALLAIDLAGNKSTLSKYNLKTQGITTLANKINIDGQLDQKDKLFKINKNQIITQQNTQQRVVATVTGDIVATIGTINGIYLQVKQEEEQTLLFFSFETMKIEKYQTLSPAAYAVWDMHPFNKKLLFETSTTNQDIVLLKVSK